jgi:hypothetical protein
VCTLANDAVSRPSLFTDVDVWFERRRKTDVDVHGNWPMLRFGLFETNGTVTRGKRPKK